MRKTDSMHQESSNEVKERLARRARILHDRNAMEPTMRKQFGQIDEFRDNVRGFKQETIELSKKFIVELEEQQKNDRIKWLQKQRNID